MRDQTLVIKGERRQVDEVREGSYCRMEATYGSFQRDVPLPEGYEAADLHATYVDGVLEIVIPRAAEEPAAPSVRS